MGSPHRVGMRDSECRDAVVEAEKFPGEHQALIIGVGFMRIGPGRQGYWRDERYLGGMTASWTYPASALIDANFRRTASGFASWLQKRVARRWPSEVNNERKCFFCFHSFWPKWVPIVEGFTNRRH